MPRVKLTATWGQIPRAEPCQGVQVACRSLRLRAKSALARSRPLVSTSTCWVTGPWASTEIKGTLAFLGRSWGRSSRGVSVPCRTLPISAPSHAGERPPSCMRFSDHTLCFCSWGGSGILSSPRNQRPLATQGKPKSKLKQPRGSKTRHSPALSAHRCIPLPGPTRRTEAAPLDGRAALNCVPSKFLGWIPYPWHGRMWPYLDSVIADVTRSDEVALA